MDGLTIDSSTFDAALLRLISTSKKSAVEVMRQQARLLFVEVAKVTPPAGGASGNTLQGKAAEQAGKLSIVRDLHQVYGMPGRAHSDILAAAGPRRAAAFWACYKENRMADAALIVKADLNKSFVPFDGGKSARGFLGKKRKKEALFYISNPEALNSHIEQLQQHVWYLASGWSSALRALGAKLPYGVGKHSGPGLLKVETNDQRIVITMTNEVSYARQIKNLQSQINFAMKVRTGVLERQWQEWMKRLARESGFKA